MTPQHTGRMHHTLAIAFTAALVTLSGCGHGLATPATASTGGPSTPRTTASHPQPGPSVTLRGIIEPGPMPGCNVLVAQNGAHYLLLDTTNPPRGIPVTVTGIPQPTLISYCNNGQPLHVQHITKP